MSITWIETTEQRYDDMLCVLPPACWTSLGFLVGEPMKHDTCPVTGKFGALFSCYIKVGNTYFAAVEPISIRGLKEITASDKYPKNIPPTMHPMNRYLFGRS